MNILDENIPKNQRLSLERWGLRVKQVGVNVGRRGMQDDEIIPFLQRQRRSTFFTRDEGFFHRHLCHPRYCLVYLAVDKYETALFIRRLLKQEAFDTQAKRMGAVIRASSAGMSFWRLHAEREQQLDWK